MLKVPHDNSSARTEGRLDASYSTWSYGTYVFTGSKTLHVAHTRGHAFIALSIARGSTYLQQGVSAIRWHATHSAISRRREAFSIIKLVPHSTEPTRGPHT